MTESIELGKASAGPSIREGRSHISIETFGLDDDDDDDDDDVLTKEFAAL